MLLRVVVVLGAAAYVVYRVRLALEIRRARRAGDTERIRRLRARPVVLFQWVVGIVVVLLLLFTVLLSLSTR